MKKTKYWFVLAFALVSTIGCGSSGSTSPSYMAPAGNATGRSAASIGTSGGHLVDANGFTLYTATSCSGSCLTVWPPMEASQAPMATAGVNQGSIALSSGQVTYNSQLLYYFESDTAAGQASGNGVGGFSFVSP